MRKRIGSVCAACAVALFAVLLAAGGAQAKAQKWWETWEFYPEVPTISPAVAKKLLLQEKSVLVYGGYGEQKNIICGSEYISVGWVPPHADGSQVHFNYPKDYWVIVYCP